MYSKSRTSSAVHCVCRSVWSLCCTALWAPVLFPGGCVKAPGAFLRPQVGSLSQCFLCLTSGNLCLYLCALPLYSSGLFWLLFTRIHCHHRPHMLVCVALSVSADICACVYCAQCMCVASSLLSWSLHKAKWYPCVFSLPKSVLLTVS